MVPTALRPTLRAHSPSPKFVLHVPILMYHRVVPYAQARDSRLGLVVPPEIFAAQLAALEQAGWRTITAAQLADDLERGVAPAPKTFVITLDDGWSDGYTYAFPVLRSYNYVATFYVIASRIGKGSFLSPDQLRVLAAAGNEIGDHTMDHVGLAGESGTRLAFQIDAAAATIAEVTGQWPTTLAYPSGNFNQRAMNGVAACSPMRMAVIEGDGTYESWSTRFATPRVKVLPGTSPEALLQWVSHPWTPAVASPKPPA